MRRLAATLLCAVAILAGAVAAYADERDDDEALERARKRWEELTPEEQRELLKVYERLRKLSERDRERQRKAWEEHLKGLSPQERKELLEKLEEVRERKDREELRRRLEKLRGFERKIMEDLPEHLKKRIAGLEPRTRGSLIRYAVERGRESMQRRVMESLTEEERRRILSLPGPQRFRAFGGLMRNATPEVKKAVREDVVTDVQELLELPPREMTAKLREADRVRSRFKHKGRIARALEEMGYRDPALTTRLAEVPPEKLPPVMKELRRISRLTDADEREKALAALLEKLPPEGGGRR